MLYYCEHGGVNVMGLRPNTYYLSSIQLLSLNTTVLRSVRAVRCFVTHTPRAPHGARCLCVAVFRDVPEIL